MKKILLLATIFGAIQSCSMLDVFDSAGKAVETARYRSIGWAPKSELDEKYRNTGYVATLECRRTDMEEWCRVLSVGKE